MGDIMGEIVLHLLNRPMAEHSPDKIPKHEDKHEKCGGRTGKYACHLPQYALVEWLYTQTIETVV